MERDRREVTARSHVVGLCAIVGAYLLACVLTWDQIDEDAYIYFRAAENLVDGHGYVFNRGDERIETGSSPLWQLLLVVGAALPLDIVPFAKLLGLAFGAASLVLVYRLGRAALAQPVSWLVPPFLLAASAPFVVWSQRGLETPLHVCLLVWLTLWLVRPPRARAWVIPAVALLFGRPEAPLLLLLILAPFLIGRRREWRTWAPGVIAIALVLLLTSLARLAYFHDLVVSAFHVRPVGADPGEPLRLLLRGAVPYAPLIAFVAFLCQPRRWTPPLRTILVVCVVLVGWSAMASDAFKPFHRHFVPAIPFVCLLACAGVEQLWSRLGARRIDALVAAQVLLAVATAAQPLVAVSAGRSVPNPIHTGLRALTGESRADFPWEPIGASYQVRVGEFIARNLPASSTVVYDQMGQTPWYAGPDVRFIDTQGLTDRRIGWWRGCRAGAGGRAYRSLMVWLSARLFADDPRTCSARSIRTYLLESEPDLVLVNRQSAAPAMRPLRSDARFRSRYEHRYWLGTEDLRRLIEVHEPRGALRRTLDVPDGLVLEEVPRGFRPRRPR